MVLGVAGIIRVLDFHGHLVLIHPAAVDDILVGGSARDRKLGVYAAEVTDHSRHGRSGQGQHSSELQPFASPLKFLFHTAL